MEFFKILYEAFLMIFSFDYDLYEIILLSLKVSGIATFIAFILGSLTGYILVINKIKFANIIIILLNSLMGIPPVVVGLIVYFIFSRNGILGVFSILYTPVAIIIAQIIIVYPIASSLMKDLFEEFWYRFKDPLLSFNMSLSATIYIFFKNSKNSILTILFVSFGRAISEVGAVAIVGGNIDHYTRVMTTAIALETSMGNLTRALALGIILLILSMFITGLGFVLNRKKTYYKL